ncbi:lipopolysaccharide biosynthesis protein [Phycicoccus duodecadis]|uniref:PST family polysaccharide transporter n=1 Tax=Phycicoccus duodecadis TaxID=173053 RepID=A0A2N3YJV7_9MICO|nr:lipopolysaccharide biosynthesis protein [Phycicoccus duodecadis]PKW27078.1 PST family polysaccharide transporter [Phycicoccus duodecadis]
MTTSYGVRAGRGVAATLGNQAYRILLQAASIVLLARLLTPADFGLVAMVLAVIGIGEILRDLGLSGAAIQAPELSTGQRDNLFWLNTGMGAAVSVVVAAAAPLVAAGYGRPELLGITLALAPSFLLSGLATQHRVGLLRDLRFQRLALVESAAMTVALGVGIGLALAGAGYWALVAQQVASGLVGLGLIVGADPWRPRWFRRGQGTTHFIRFGGHLLASTVVTYVGSNADTVLVGRAFGADVLGLYNRGAQLVRQPARQFSSAFGTVLQPILAKIHTDRARLEVALRDGQLAGAYPLALGAAVVAAAPVDVVRLAMGPRWLDAAPYVTAMCAGVVLRQVTNSVSQGLVACGLGSRLSQYTLFSSVVTTACIALSVLWGPVAVAWVAAMAPLLTWTVGHAALTRWTGVHCGRLRADGARVMLLALAATLAGRLLGAQLGGLHELGRFLVVAGVVVAVFAAATLLPPVRRDAQQLVRQVRESLGRGSRPVPRAMP